MGTGSALQLHGPVPDLRAALSTAQVAVARLDSGGGMKLKVLQYHAAGLPVISSPKAFAGLPDPHAFARRAAAAPGRRWMEPGGVPTAESEFSWAAAAVLALHAYRSTIRLTGIPASGRAAQPDVLAMAGRTPYWLHEWRTRQEPRTRMGESTTPASDSGQHPVLARLASEIDCARQAAESALGTVFDQAAIVGYGGRSMVFLSKTAILKIYTHRPAERAQREITGLTLAATAAGLRVPEVLGHDSVDGALAWVSATRLDGTAPTDPSDEQATALLGTVAARLHALPAEALTDLPPFRRNIRPLSEDAHPVRARLSAVLAGAEPVQLASCVPGFVHGDYSARNLLLAPGLEPGVIDFEGCGSGCVYEDLTNLYVQNCLIDGRDPHLALTAYGEERVRLGRPLEVDTRHLLFHTAHYFLWVLQWATEIDTALADQVTALAPQVLDAFEAEGTPQL